MKKAVLFLFLVTGLMAQAQQDTAKKEFKPSGKVWGYAFGDYYYKMHNDSLNRGVSQYSGIPETANTFEFRRVYLGYDYAISERFSTELLLSYEGQTLSDNATRTVFIKSANVRWKNIYKNADLVFGLQATPAFPLLVEKMWGYRSIEKTLIDMRKGAGSTDLGIGLQGKCGEKGSFGYNFLVANGTGTKIETDIFKKFYGDVYAKILDDKLVFDLYGDFEKTSLTPGLHKYRSNAKLAVFFTTDAVTAGVEGYVQLQHNYIGYFDNSGSVYVSDTTNGMAMGAALYVRGRIIKDKLGFFARGDMYNPDLTYNAQRSYTMGANPVTEMFAVAGIDYTPHKNVHLMPNIWYNGYSNRASNVRGRNKADYDLVPRLTFWYVFR